MNIMTTARWKILKNNEKDTVIIFGAGRRKLKGFNVRSLKPGIGYGRRDKNRSCSTYNTNKKFHPKDGGWDIY